MSGRKTHAVVIYCGMEPARGEPEAAAGDRLSRVWATIITLLILYFLPLALVAVDELVLGTYWFVKAFPDGAREVFLTVYPFVRFLVE
jgi:hypothetical protein